MPTKQSISARLAAVRRGKKIKQQSVADGSGLSLQSVKRLEAGVSFPRIDTLAQYLQGCDVTVGEFFAPLIRPGTMDYDRECYALLTEILSRPGQRESLKRLLKALAEGSL